MSTCKHGAAPQSIPDSTQSIPDITGSTARQRCHAEIATAEAELRAGNPDIHGLLLCIRDWTDELMLIALEEGAQ
jgi:hypothetical protein